MIEVKIKKISGIFVRCSIQHGQRDKKEAKAKAIAGISPGKKFIYSFR